MKLNKTQKRILLLGAIVTLAALTVWVSYGGEIFTKTRILVEKKDAFFGTTYKEWKDQFVLGLDYTIAFSGLIAAITLLSTFVKRDKKRKIK